MNKTRGHTRNISRYTIPNQAPLLFLHAIFKDLTLVFPYTRARSLVFFKREFLFYFPLPTNTRLQVQGLSLLPLVQRKEASQPGGKERKLKFLEFTDACKKCYNKKWFIVNMEGES